MRVGLIMILMLMALRQADAIVWRSDLKEKGPGAEGLMKQVGKISYSPLKVFGSSCLAIGGKWVLTCRHGTETWSGVGLTVQFPELGKRSYQVKKILFPEKGDLALLKLDQEVAEAKPVPMFEGKVKQGQRTWIGGFGLSGPAGKVKGSGELYSGHNRVDGLRRGKISISLGKPMEDSTEADEATVALFDSGSPMFLEVEKGSWQLAGIASTASNGRNPGYGDRGNYARVSGVREWITKSVEEK